MRLEAKGSPNPADHCVTDSDLRSHLAGTPVRPTLWGCLECLDDDRLHSHVGDLARSSDPGLSVKPLNPLRDEALPPLAHRLVRRPTPTSDVRAANPLGTRQHQLRPKGEMPVHPGPLGQPNTLLPFFSNKDQRCLRTTNHLHELVRSQKHILVQVISFPGD